MTPTYRILKLAGLMPMFALAACAGSQRFTGPVPGGPTVGYSEPTLQSAPPVVSTPVTSQPLPPPGGSYPTASAQPGGALPPPGSDPYYGAPPPGQPGPGVPVGAPGSAPVSEPALRGSNQTAALGSAPTATPRGASRDSVVGNWTAREATGGSCRVSLSSSPALDLYRASASGCSNRDLQRVTAWDYRDGEVYLYQQGGTVIARMRSTGGALDGAITKSGAALSMSR